MKKAEKVFSQMTKFSAREIQELLKKAKTCLAHPLIKIKKAPRAGTYARALLIIPKRIGNAVVRNKVRRRIKNILYQEKMYLGAMDYVIYVYPGLDQYTFQQLKECIGNL